jgi:pullulanase/glycogen debranching enzyme
VNDDDIYVMVNAGAHTVRFQIQEGSPGDWLLVADTSLPSPLDFVEPEERKALTSADYPMGGRSVAVLCCRSRR